MFGSYEPFLEIFSLKKFSRVVVYCSVIKVPVVLSLRQLWYFIKSFSLCQELFYFSFLFLPSLTSQLKHNTISNFICQQFFQLFSTNFHGTIFSIFTRYHPQYRTLHAKTTGNFPVVLDNIKRRKRDLNPRAGFPTYTLSRGASSASWVFLLILNTTTFKWQYILFASMMRNLLY